MRFDTYYVAQCMGYNDDNEAHQMIQTERFFNKHKTCPLCDCVWEDMISLMEWERGRF